ncbi:tetraspanin-18B-like [Stigmatopora argus]
MGHGEASARRTSITGDCLSCIKYLMLIFNTSFVVAGCLLVGLGLLGMLGTSTLGAVVNLHQGLKLAIYFVLGVGASLFLLGFLGCCGTLRENRCLLLFFLLLIFFVFLAELGAAGWTLSTQRESLTVDELAKQMKHKFKSDEKDPYSKAWTTLMFKYDCCGIKGMQDFQGNSHVAPHKVPLSCCITMETEATECRQGQSSKIHQEGCYQKIYETVEPYMYIGLAFCILILTFELLAMSVAMCLFRGLQFV